MIRRGDLVWTLDQCYGVVETLAGDYAHVFVGDGRRVKIPSGRVFPVDVHGSFVGISDRAANFGAILRNPAAALTVVNLDDSGAGLLDHDAGRSPCFAEDSGR